jgi:hypothetical protein
MTQGAILARSFLIAEHDLSYAPLLLFFAMTVVSSLSNPVWPFCDRLSRRFMPVAVFLQGWGCRTVVPITMASLAVAEVLVWLHPEAACLVNCVVSEKRHSMSIF